MIWNRTHPPEPEPESSSDLSLERKLHLCSQRYRLFFQKAGDITQRLLAEREAFEGSGQSFHAVRLSEFITIEELERLVESDDLLETEIWQKHLDSISTYDDEDLAFDDWPEANVILDKFDNRHDAVARILALNESFAGFFKLIVSWLEGRDMYLDLFRAGRKSNWNESSPELELVAILQGDIPELPEEDIWGATTFIMSMADSELDRAD